MPSWRLRLSRVPVIGPAAIFAHRTREVVRHIVSPIPALTRWLVTSREVTNYTEDLDPIDEQYLIEFVATVTGQPRETIGSYVAELHANSELREHVRVYSQLGPEGAQSDPVARYGRRVGWYALVRATKPRVLVETGIDKGLGSCVLAAALLRNRTEGHPGTYYGTEIDLAKGVLFRPPYNAAGQILWGDSIASLEQLDATIDCFVNDSDHSVAYEAREYQTIANKLSPTALIIGDNAHCNDELLKFALSTGRKFLFYTERPRRHWFGGGAGIGVAYGSTNGS